MESVSIFPFDPYTIRPSALCVIFGHDTTSSTRLVNWLVASVPQNFEYGLCLSTTSSFRKMFPERACGSDIQSWVNYTKCLEACETPFDNLVIVDHLWSKFSTSDNAHRKRFLARETNVNHKSMRIIVDGHPWAAEGTAFSVNRIASADYVFLFSNRNIGQREVVWTLFKSVFDTFRNFSRYWDQLATYKRCMVISVKAILEGKTSMKDCVFYCDAPATPSPKFGHPAWWNVGQWPLTPLPRFDPADTSLRGRKFMHYGTQPSKFVKGFLTYLSGKNQVEWVNAISRHQGMGLDPSCVFPSIDAWNPDLVRTMIKTMGEEEVLEKTCFIFDYEPLVKEWPRVRSIVFDGPILIVVDAKPDEDALELVDLAVIQVDKDQNPETIYPCLKLDNLRQASFCLRYRQSFGQTWIVKGGKIYDASSIVANGKNVKCEEELGCGSLSSLSNPFTGIEEPQSVPHSPLCVPSPDPPRASSPISDEEDSPSSLSSPCPSPSPSPSDSSSSNSPRSSSNSPRSLPSPAPLPSPRPTFIEPLPSKPQVAKLVPVPPRRPPPINTTRLPLPKIVPPPPPRRSVHKPQPVAQPPRLRPVVVQPKSLKSKNNPESPLAPAEPKTVRTIPSSPPASPKRAPCLAGSDSAPKATETVPKSTWWFFSS